MFEEKGAKIGNIGDSIIDRFTIMSDPIRKSPEDPDAPCVHILRETNQPGGAGCAARCGVNLGGIVELYSVCGSDGKADLLRKILAESRINAHLVVDECRDTTLKNRLEWRATGKQLVVTERESREPIPKKVEIQLLEEIFKSEAKVFLLSDYGRGVCTPNLVCTVSQFCSVESRKLVVDGRERGKDWYKLNLPHIFLIKPNRREAAAMVGKKEEEFKTLEDVQAAAKTLHEELECNVLITLDKEGALLCTGPEEFRKYEAENKKPVSVSGAGDTLAVTICLGLSIGMPLEEACEWGMVAAGITVSKPGSEVVTLTEFKAAIQRRNKDARAAQQSGIKLAGVEGEASAQEEAIED